MKDIAHLVIVLIVIYRTYCASLETAGRLLLIQDKSQGIFIPKWLSLALPIRCEEEVRALGVCFSFVGPFLVKLGLIAYIILGVAYSINSVFCFSNFAITRSSLVLFGIIMSVYGVSMIVLFELIDWFISLLKR